MDKNDDNRRLCGTILIAVALLSASYIAANIAVDLPHLAILALVMTMLVIVLVWGYRMLN